MYLINFGANRRSGPLNSAEDTLYTRGTFLRESAVSKDMIAQAGAGPEPEPRNMLSSQSLFNGVRLLLAQYSKASCEA